MTSTMAERLRKKLAPATSAAAGAGALRKAVRLLQLRVDLARSSSAL